MPLTALDVAKLVSGELEGNPLLEFTGLEQLDSAGPEHITFVRDEANLATWAKSQAGLTIVPSGLKLPADHGKAIVRVKDADGALTKLLVVLAPPARAMPPGAHPTAVIDASAQIDPTVSIGPNCVIGAGTKIGANTAILANVTIMAYVTIGQDCRIEPGTVIYDRCTLQDRVILQSCVVIGSDGFGYRPSEDPKRPGPARIPHIGTVLICSDVEIGSGSCIDRGKFSATYIGMGTKIDNQCLIAHNCRIGRFCLIAGQTGIAGSVTVGDGVQMGGKVAIRDHVSIGSGVRLAACSAVMESIPAGQTWGGVPAREARFARREYVAARQLPEILKILKKKFPGILDEEETR
jgi:UDP-3-O-[3-hydroxymyristoyl] glucosamine N-acyltransferase